MGEEMEANTCYLGIELNDSYAMVSYMQPNMEEPETVSTIAGSETVSYTHLTLPTIA